MFKFLHAADIHLDSPLRGLGRSDDLPVDEIRGATRRALGAMVRLAIDERVAFVLIAGDVYDGDWTDHNTGLWFVKQMIRLRDAAIPVYLIQGNHDAASRITTHLPLPDNVKSLSTARPETVEVPHVGVLIHGQGFAQQKVVDDLAAGYPAPRSGTLNIGLLHTSADGKEGGEHARYAPCTVDALRRKGYGYWALGHIHTRAMLHETGPCIAFPGNIQGRHIKETGPKGCLIVEVDDRMEIARSEFKALDVIRWEHARVDATGATDRGELLARFEAEVPALLAAAGHLPLALRVEFIGPTEVHDRLMADLPRFDAEVRSIAMNVGGGRLGVERVRLATRPDRLAAGADGDDAIGILLATLDGLRDDPTALADLARVELGDLWKRLAGEVSGFDSVRFDSLDWLRETLEASRSILTTRLVAT